MKNRNKFCLIVLSLMFVVSTLAPTFFVQASGSGTQTGGDPVEIKNPLGDQKPDPNVLIGRVISAILSLVGAVALLMIVYGGVLWMFAAGNKENITKGKDIIIWTALGMLLIFSSYAIIKFILSALTGKTG